MSLIILANSLLAGNMILGLTHALRPLGSWEYETQCANRFQTLMLVAMLLDLLGKNPSFDLSKVNFMGSGKPPEC